MGGAEEVGDAKPLDWQGKMPSLAVVFSLNLEEFAAGAPSN